MSLDFDPALFSDDPAFIAQARDEQREEAKRILLPRARIATADHNGKHLTEERWRWFIQMLESL